MAYARGQESAGKRTTHGKAGLPHPPRGQYAARCSGLADRMLTECRQFLSVDVSADRGTLFLQSGTRQVLAVMFRRLCFEGHLVPLRFEESTGGSACLCL